jgi:hypothetical protein
MGYRSQVRIIMPKKNFEELKANCPKEIDYMFSGKCVDIGYTEREVSLSNNQGEEEKAVIFGYNWVKWYDEYDDVGYINGYLKKLQEQDIPFKCVEVGEDGATEEMCSDCLYDDKEYYDVIYGTYGIEEEV